jgi:glutathione S-transferase
LDTSGDEAVAIAKALAELEGRRKEVVALKDALGAEQRRSEALEAAFAACERAAALWKQAAAERRDANVLDSALQKSYEESVTRYKEELERVRKERDSARRSRWTFATVALVLGVAIGVVAAKD